MPCDKLVSDLYVFTIEEFLASGIYNSYKNSKITAIHIVGCENLLESPGDPLFLGFFKENKL